MVIIMKKDDWEDIEVNQRSKDKVLFESNLIQQIYDGIDLLRDESAEILRELDIEGKIDDLDLEKFAEDTITQIDDLLDDISRFKDSVVDTEDLPDDVKEHYRNTQAYFNRDADYLRRAKSKMARLNSEKLADEYGTNHRIVELCDKAITIRPESFDAHLLKAQALVNLGKYADAIDEYIIALAIKDDADLWLAIADANRLNGDFEDALEVYDYVLKKYGKSVDVLKGKAVVCFDIGDYVGCNGLFSQANDIDIYAVDLSVIFKDTNSVTERVSYTPSLFVYIDGEVAGYLDPGSDADLSYYQTLEGLSSFVAKYLEEEILKSDTFNEVSDCESACSITD